MTYIVNFRIGFLDIPETERSEQSNSQSVLAA